MSASTSCPQGDAYTWLSRIWLRARQLDGGGLHLVVDPNGSRSAANPTQLPFGPEPTVSLADARQKREGARKLSLDGRNPSAPRKLGKNDAAISEGNTFESLAADEMAHRARRGAFAGYRRCDTRETRHAVSEDAAAGIDLAHDAADADAGIAVALLALWGAKGVVGSTSDGLATCAGRRSRCAGGPCRAATMCRARPARTARRTPALAGVILFRPRFGGPAWRAPPLAG